MLKTTAYYEMLLIYCRCERMLFQCNARLNIVAFVVVPVNVLVIAIFGGGCDNDAAD